MHRPDMRACATWLARHLRQMGLNAAIHQTKGHPIVLATSPRRKNVPTVLIYGHYDVQPPDPLESWKTPPFRPVVSAGKLYGRGASDDKGQLFTHIKGVESFLRTGTALPVNIIFLIEGEEELTTPPDHASAVDNAAAGMQDRAQGALAAEPNGAATVATAPPPSPPGSGR